MAKKLVNLENSRTEHQRQNMAQAMKSKECLFCEQHLAKYHQAPIERRGQYWLVTKNDYPYDGTELHYLFIYRKHIDSLGQIAPGAMNELSGHLKWLEKKFKIKGGAILIRFGDSNRSSATITHFHGHFIVGRKRAPGKDRIMAALGYKK